MNLRKIFQSADIVFPFIQALVTNGLPYRIATYITARAIAHLNKDITFPDKLGKCELPEKNFPESKLFSPNLLKNAKVGEYFVLKTVDCERINHLEIQDCIFYNNKSNRANTIGFNPVVFVRVFGQILEEINNEKNGVKAPKETKQNSIAFVFNAETSNDLYNSLLSELNAENDLNTAIYEDKTPVIDLTNENNIKLFIFTLSLLSSSARTQFELFGYYKTIFTFGKKASAFIESAIAYKGEVTNLIKSKTSTDRMYNILAWHTAEVGKNLKRGSGTIEHVSSAYSNKSIALFEKYYEAKCPDGNFHNMKFPNLQEITELFSTAELAGKVVPVDYIILTWLNKQRNQQ